MSEIPDDIHRASDAVIEKNFGGEYFDPTLWEDIARAILAERERCAKICESIAADSREEAVITAAAKNYTAANHWNAHAGGCEECAAAIRSPDTTQELGRIPPGYTLVKDCAVCGVPGYLRCARRDCPRFNDPIPEDTTQERTP